MAKLVLSVVRGKLAAVTTDGVAVLKGTPEVVATKYGIYLVFPEVNETVLTRVEGHKVFHEYKVKGYSTPVFQQMRKSGKLAAGAWHVAVKDVRVL
jgi:hypothetical protein